MISTKNHIYGKGQEKLTLIYGELTQHIYSVKEHRNNKTVYEEFIKQPSYMYEYND
jgi:hypothetical protein